MASEKRNDCINHLHNGLLKPVIKNNNANAKELSNQIRVWWLRCQIRIIIFLTTRTSGRVVISNNPPPTGTSLSLSERQSIIIRNSSRDLMFAECQSSQSVGAGVGNLKLIVLITHRFLDPHTTDRRLSWTNVTCNDRDCNYKEILALISLCPQRYNSAGGRRGWYCCCAVPVNNCGDDISAAQLLVCSGFFPLLFSSPCGQLLLVAL